MNKRNWKRLFSTEIAKGQIGYLQTQKYYELLRTVLYFAISLSLLAAGVIATKTRLNLLTVAAVLGCLPACKSLVSTIMFFRFHGLSQEKGAEFWQKGKALYQLADMVFTAYQNVYVIDHLVVDGHQILCYASGKPFSEEDFAKHVRQYLSAEGIKESTVTVFFDEKKYLERITGLSEKEHTPGKAEERIGTVLKSIVL